VKSIGTFVAFGLVAGLVSAGGATAADKQYVIGVSNTLIGNGWREEFVCSIKAEALASGLVSKVVLANRNGGPSEQIADLRSLISAGVNAIIINPSDRKALDGVIKQAADKGIVVVAADQAVSAPEAYVVISDAVTYAELGAGWLFKHLNGKGNVVEMRGIDGTSGDADRKDGFDKAHKAYPDIKIAATTFTDWSHDKAAQQMATLLASNKQFDGVWTSGTDYTVVEAFKTAGKPYVPVIGADTNGFIGQLVNYKKDGFVGAAVANSPAIGAAGLVVALDVLQGKKRDKLTVITPAIWDNTTDEGVAALKALYDPNVDAVRPVYGAIKDYGHFTAEQEKACKGPGE
jgi:ribose transport system substrate-binding protein